MLGKVWFDTVLSAPSLPFILELLTMVRQYRPWKSVLPFQQSNHFPRFWFMVKLFSYHQEPAVIIDVCEEPVLFSMHSERTLKVNLPQFIRFFGSEELPTFMFVWVAIHAVLEENIVYGFSGQFDSLRAACNLQDEGWKLE